MKPTAKPEGGADKIDKLYQKSEDLWSKSSLKLKAEEDLNGGIFQV